MLSLLRLECRQKTYSNPFGICILLFVSYSLGTETINTFMHSIVPSKTIPNSRPKWAKCIPVFRPKQRKNLILPDGAAHTYMAVYKGVPPGRGVIVHFRTENHPCTGNLCCSDIDNLGLISALSQIHLYNQIYWQYKDSCLLTGIYFRERLTILLISLDENFKLVLLLYF